VERKFATLNAVSMRESPPELILDGDSSQRANPLILVIAGDHWGPLESLFSLDSSGVRDVGVAGSNPVTPTMKSTVCSGYIGNRLFRRHG
jgi:hypothetical protein